MSIKKTVRIIIPLFLLLGIIFVFGITGVFSKPSYKPGAEEQKELEKSVGQAIKDTRGSYGPGEAATEGHIILGIDRKDSRYKVYTISSLGVFGFENGIFTVVSGSGAIPTVMSFSKKENGEFSLLEYKEPMDGSYYTKSIKGMFPARMRKRVLAAHNDYGELQRQQEEQAGEYLKSIGREAEVSAAHVEKKLADIDTQASNKLFAELSKYDQFFNSCPYWIGTREQIENGVRYIYEVSQSKDSDGYDIIAFKKSKEDGTPVREVKYRIVGSEPQILK